VASNVTHRRYIFVEFSTRRRRRFDIAIRLEELVLVPRVQLDPGANEKSHWLGGGRFGGDIHHCS
jgi:hypothetical protein